MTAYALLFFDGMYRVQERRDFDSPSDAVAVSVAERACGARLVELWRRDGKFLHKVEPASPAWAPAAAVALRRA